ncbi:MAG TPA: response regulator [Polyangia bacterium]|nr:response regulator [Polyangia bacterium]
MPAPIDILLVDDEARNLDALEAILADPAYRLLRAEDANRALHLLLENDVAAIVLDIKMPQVDGIELAQTIKNTRRFRETPILFLTAHMVDEQHIIAGYDAGGADYLTKPVNPQVLRHKIGVLAELFRKTRQLAELNDKLEARVRERTTELERSEAALRENARQKDEFLAILAHELRNPLVPLRTGLDLLVRRQEAPPSERTLEMMNRQLTHMVRLIDDLLDISRISRGLLELEKETVSLRSVVEATAESLRSVFERRSQQLSLDLADGIQAEIDPTRVAQILTNLLTNASKFTPEAGRIAVALTWEGARAAVRVVDSGSGIPTDKVQDVFGMFARVERPGIANASGLGIGLALARRLAEMHGGTLTAASAGEGQGSTFTLTLPARLSAPAPAAALPAPAAPASAGGLRILIIEDSREIVDALSELLQEMGHRTWAALTGPDGIALIEDARPHVVFCDLGLPLMSGLEVCRRIRALPLAVRPLIVALSGWGREDDRHRTAEAGFDHHLVKPVRDTELSRLLATVEPAAQAD